MKEITLGEAISLRKNLLCEFDKICKENDLKYSLGYGSLLGAVRHKGMIPWDDDIDVVMPRADYEKLCDIYSDSHQTQRYQLVNHRNHPEIATKISYFNDFTTITDFAGKLQEYKGVHIDIFPLDILPDDSVKKNRLLSKRASYQRIIKVKDVHPEVFSGYQKAVRLLAKLTYSVFNSDSTYENLDNLAKKYVNLSPEEGAEAACLVESGSVCTFSRQVMDKYCLYKFDEYEFYGFENYDEPLTAWYGDYMTPPPEEEQKVFVSEWVHHYYKDN